VDKSGVARFLAHSVSAIYSLRYANIIASRRNSFITA